MEPPKPAEPTPFEKFSALTKKVIAVPREEIQRRERDYKQARKTIRAHNRKSQKSAS